MFPKTDKYDALLAQYVRMADQGYNTTDGQVVDQAFATQEAVKFRDELRPIFEQAGVRSVLDYGGGGRPWDQALVDETTTLADYLGVSTYRVFEPGRNIDDRQPADAVVCFDVLEHVFVGDLGYVVSDLLGLATKIAVINVACYKARAVLPNGENAHITVRAPMWWKGVIDLMASAYPQVKVVLYCSEAYNRATRMGDVCFATINAARGFTR